MRLRIRWRIILPSLILLLMILLAFSFLIVSNIRKHESARWEEQILDTAHLVAEQVYPLYTQQAPTHQFTILAQNTSKILGLTTIFLDQQGSVLGMSYEPERPPQNLSGLPAISNALESGTGTYISTQHLSAAVSIRDDNDELLGFAYLQAPHSYYQLKLEWIYSLAFAVLLVSALAVIVFSMIIQDRSRKPVEMLTLAAEQMSMGNFNNLDFPETKNELQALSQALQNMAQQLGEQIDALTSERAKLSAVLNQMTDGVIIADAEGRVQLLNPAAGRLFQIDEKNALGRSLVEVIRYHQLIALWRNTRDGERQTTMLEIGPQHMFLQVVATPLKISLPGSTMILFQDLTQLRRLETVRRDFISNVSHELRTPLASMKALAETLQEGALEDPPAARRFILRMETEIDNLTQLVNELLELSRIESGKVPLSFQRIQPCNLLQPAYERMTLQAERAALELRLECQPELPAVFADPDRITQVLINLVHNAIKFTQPGGKIILSAYQDKDHIVFFVKDTGVGIARKDLGRIFERFFKADRARSGGGTGLGLSIARHMIESHGGYIWAESEKGIGSTLYFSLPSA